MPEKDILIVDDEAGVRDLFKETLQGNGYLADVVGTASEARELLEKHPYRLVVADWRLPDGDGTIIANLAAEAGADAFVMSGYLSHMPPGCVDPRQTLMKPIRQAELLAIVRGCIGKPSTASDRENKNPK